MPFGILIHFNKSSKQLDVLLYKISIHLDPLMISKNITEEITSKLLTPEISELIDSTTNSLTTLIEKLEPISKTIKKTSYNKPSEPIKPYAPFKIDEALNSLISEGFDGAILVGIDNGSERMNEYTYNHSFLNHSLVSSKSGDKYMDFLVNIVKPYVDSNYQTKKTREHTTIAGRSMGGLISFFGGLENLEIFGNIIAFSTSTQIISNEVEFENYLTTVNNELLKNTKYYLYVGTLKDGNQNWPDDFKILLNNLNVSNNNIKVKKGQGLTHNEYAWSLNIKDALKYVFGL